MSMGRVLVLIRIFPKDIDINLESLAEKIKESLGKEYSIIQYKEEPIAFGLKALKILIAMPELKEGGTYELEQTIQNLDEVSEVEILQVTRAL